MDKREANEPIIRRIESELARQGIAKTTLYDYVGISRSAFSYWKTGKAIPTMDNLWKIADFLSVDFEWLVYGKEKAAGIQPSGDDILRIISDNLLKLDLEYLIKLRSLVDGLVTWKQLQEDGDLLTKEIEEKK